MKYWQLQIESPRLGREIIDLRYRQKISVGESGNNDISIETIEVPSQHTLLRKNLWGSWDLYITDELKPHLQGSLREIKSYKNPLYNQTRYRIQGPVSLKIADHLFVLDQAETLALGPAPEEKSVFGWRDWTRASSYSVGFHLLLLLLFGLWNAFLRPSQETHLDSKEYAKVHIQTLDKVFPKTLEAPQNLEPIEAPASPKVEKAKDELKSAEKLLASGPKAKPSSKQGSKSTAPKADLASLGVLAFQASAQSRSSNLDLKTINHQESARTGRLLTKKSIGLGGDENIMMADASEEQVAMLDQGKGISGYAGGMGDKVVEGEKGRSSIRLVKREVEIRGALDPNIIRQVIEERLPEMRYCYETALLQHKNLSGKVLAQFTIQADGSVSNLKAESSDQNIKKLETCLSTQMKDWKFPNPRGGGIVHVKYPFLFTPLGI